MDQNRDSNPAHNGLTHGFGASFRGPLFRRRASKNGSACAAHAERQSDGKTGHPSRLMHRDEISQMPINTSLMRLCDARKLSAKGFEAVKKWKVQKALPHRF
jgi:hypothetical protein